MARTHNNEDRQGKTLNAERDYSYKKAGLVSSRLNQIENKIQSVTNPTPDGERTVQNDSNHMVLHGMSLSQRH